MTNSQFCIQQRQKEQTRLNKLLIAGFASSAAVHGILAYALPKWSFDPPKTAEEPIEMILVDKPKPKPQPQPKIESKPIVEPKPKPVKPPEPVKAQTLPPPVKPVKPPEPVAAQTPLPPVKPVKPPEPVAAQTAPPKPKPIPKKLVTDPTPAPSQPIVSAPVENPGRSSSSNIESSSSSVVAANSAPPRPEVNDGGEEGISCVNNCEPEYPASLEGEEGNAGVKLTIDSNGNVVGAELVEADGNSEVNLQALLAARQMQFSSPGSSSAIVRVNIDFTVEGSEYDRTARKEQEAARQARQEQLAREQVRQQELQQQPETQVELTPPSVETESESQPLPTLSPEELDEERLRKFRERIENYQK